MGTSGNTNTTTTGVSVPAGAGAGAAAGGDKTQQNQTTDRAENPTTPVSAQQSGNAGEKSVSDKWSELKLGYQILIIGAIVLVLILSVVGIYCCCKSDEEKVVMQPQYGYPMHAGHYGHRRSSPSRVSRTPGRSRYSRA